MSRKSDIQERAARVSRKSVPQGLSDKSILQEYPTRVSYKRVSRIVWPVFEYVFAFEFVGSICQTKGTDDFLIRGRSDVAV